MPSISIRRTIHLLIIAPLIIVMGLTGALVFLTGRKIVDHVAEHLSNEVSNHIIKHTQNYLNRPHVVLDGVLGAANSEIADLDHFPSLEKYLFQLVRQDEGIKKLYYGDERGRFLGVQQSHQNKDQFHVKVKENPKDSELKIHSLNDRGKRHKHIASNKYNPHSQHWYQHAKKTEQPSWSKVYADSSSSALSVSPVVPIYDRNNQLQGVLSVQISLTEISNFLKEIKDSSSLDAFIIDRDGHIIASSADELISIKIDKGYQRLAAINSSEPIIKATTKQILKQFETFEQITDKNFLTFNFAGERQLIQIAPLENREHLDWLVAVVIPEGNFMSALYHYDLLILIFALALTAIAIYVALKMSNWIVKPIKEFDHAVKDIEQQNFEPNSLDAIASRQDEFGQLGRVFQLMATVVYQRELSLQQQVDKLQQEQKQLNESALITHFKIDRWQKLINQAKQMREKTGNREQGPVNRE